jgi:hypothetical protein
MRKRHLNTFTAKQRSVNKVSGGIEQKMGHEGNKMISVWIPAERYDQLEEFLNKFSTGESFADQFRQFIFWILDQKEGIKTSALTLRLEEVRKKKEAEEIHCLRGVMKPWQYERVELRSID